jgi:hypothetical protein
MEVGRLFDVEAPAIFVAHWLLAHHSHCITFDNVNSPDKICVPRQCGLPRRAISC